MTFFFFSTFFSNDPPGQDWRYAFLQPSLHFFRTPCLIFGFETARILFHMKFFCTTCPPYYSHKTRIFRRRVCTRAACGSSYVIASNEYIPPWSIAYLIFTHAVSFLVASGMFFFSFYKIVQNGPWLHGFISRAMKTQWFMLSSKL